MHSTPLRVLVADDRALDRKIVSEELRSLPGLCIVGTATNGRAALEKVKELRPSLLVLNCELPEIDGLGVLRESRASANPPHVLMLGSAAAVTTLARRAMRLGALDCLIKPDDLSAEETKLEFGKLLRDKVAALIEPAEWEQPAAWDDRIPAVQAENSQSAADGDAGFSHPSAAIEAVVIGISTGGPDALVRMLPMLPANLPVPILIVQHMPPMFTKSLADDLDRRCKLRVVEAVDGMKAGAGNVYIAPGGRHMRIKRDAKALIIEVTDDPPEHSCRPAVDYLFRSAAAELEAAVLAVIMTGMGNDGTAGLRQLRARGAYVIAQDRESSIVFGMPAQPIDEGLVDVVAPLDAIAGHILRCATWRAPTCA